ncbi:DUF4838 domain-containing protein [Parapedobacter lycopersici]|uniref:DUF4838 domain-containing protein n=1 Tax=Parapedobacter lycopersici TaxID=1864939 RepID=UPI00214D6DAC|nr:DUF4838 domain-containing protein [Parapedobacter lycopersici]
MMSTTKNKDISRLDFLRTSGFMAAGLAFLPGFISCGSGSDLKKYQLVIRAGADPVEKEAAERLQHYLSEISGAAIQVVEESGFQGTHAIYLGQTDYAKTQGVNADQLADGGYSYKPVGNHIIIAGGAKKGLLYGVYDLLEAVGFRMYSPDYTYMPKDDAAAFPGAERVVAPKVTYRTTSYSRMGDQQLSDWHKVSSRDDWGLFVHTFNTLLSPEEYGKTHPEYFSLINGTRLPGTQLCLSNAKVVEIVVANLKKEIAENPEATYWSVSQNDNDQYCQCAACTALNKKYGDVPSGSMVYFVNEVAKQVPDKIISTLAYWYTRKAPKNIKPEPNVNIMLCNIESKRQAPVYETDPAFSNDLKDWASLTNDILIWDYNIQFTNFFAPFPNLFTIKPNIKFYTDHSVNALYMQANNEAAAEMALLRGYLIYKLMWDPDADDQAIIDEFVNGYYGAAGPYIRQYIDALHQALTESGMQLDIFGDPIDAKDAFLSAEKMGKYKELFDQAENAVKSDPELLQRVHVARLPIMYAEIQIGRTEIDTPRSMYQHADNGTIIAKPEMKALVEQFVAGCKKEEVALVRERAGTPDHFLESYNRIFTNMEETGSVKSFGKKVTAITQPSSKSKGVEALTDGIFASYESWQKADTNWISYEGVHMDFVLDLGEVMPVNSINMDFLNPQAQPDWHLMALPKYVTYALSADGTTYGSPIRIDNPHNPNPFENPDISKVSIQSFRADTNGKARYIKVHAENLLKMPSWHIRAGNPVSIFTDEIVVK